MNNFKKMHDEQDEFIKKTLQEDKQINQPIFEKFSISMNKSKVKVKRYSRKQKNIISILLLLLLISIGLNIYLVANDSPISITNIFQPAQDYSSRYDFSDLENTPSNQHEFVKENTISNDNTNTSNDYFYTNSSNTQNETTEVSKIYKDINNEEIKAFVNQFSIGINKLDLYDLNNLESNTILLYIAQQYFSQHSNTSASSPINTDYASSSTNVHKFLNEFTFNDYSKIDSLKSYNNYIGYMNPSKAYVYGNDYSVLSKESYKCDYVTITNQNDDVYFAIAHVSRTYENEKNVYKINFSFKINKNYKYQKYKLLSFNSELISGDVETIIRLIEN